MFEWLKMNMWKDGTEHCTAHEIFYIDSDEIGRGTSYHLINNHVKNEWVIEKWSNNVYLGVIDKGKEETLCLDEFKKWLGGHSITDAYIEWLRNNPKYVKMHPGICGEEFI